MCVIKWMRLSVCVCVCVMKERVLNPRKQKYRRKKGEEKNRRESRQPFTIIRHFNTSNAAGSVVFGAGVFSGPSRSTHFNTLQLKLQKTPLPIIKYINEKI